MVASAIALIYIVSILDDSESIPCSVESTQNGSESILGGEGGVSDAAECVSGCLPDSTQKISQKILNEIQTPGKFVYVDTTSPKP